MGVYDFFKGPCPKCGGNVGDYKGEESGDIQTKMFDPVPEDGACFRSFSPGDTLPFAPPTKRQCIGETACCGTKIDAIFDGDKLVKYEITKV